ncbi:manganese efflux pump MntP family protein [Moraxella haemolytica]|uniref:manganese efflux pump MntP n=1 Tax=Moraxella TaxID=475 RepID=UPI002542A8F1|nr:manganese efflux pump MntP family protein [Moraxella sp. ZY171148]WII96103.1 manganese efflux pump MntP family protein [Moraxella sp. ZY171148]
MSIVSLTALSFGMSMDAFASAIAKGATDRQTTLVQAFKAGLVFGVIEGVAPIIGWLIGGVASQWLSYIDHWIAFGLLLFLGLRFIHEAATKTHTHHHTTKTNKGTQDNFGLMLITAIATSIDSLVVGVSLAFLKANILLAATLIGIATTIMATLGVYLGNCLGFRFGRVAMFIGGLVLLGIGSTILYSHLTTHI